MKNSFLTLSFIFISLLSYSQEQFEGMWVEEDSSYINIILSSKYAIIKVFNFSFAENNIIEETIIKQTKDNFITELHNKTSGYKVNIEYKINGENLICQYTGDYTGTRVLTKL
jgi:hypothetical protein